MPVADHPVHPAVMRNAGHLYGCHNRAPYLDTVANGTASWPNVFTRNCQYAQDPTGYSASDPRCANCSWQQPTKTMNAVDNTKTPHTPGRVTAQTVRVTLPSTTTKHFAVGVEGTNIAVALTGPVDKDDRLESAANARRISACWNSCDGLDTEKLEKMPAPFAQMLNFGFLELWEQYTTVKDQRDELLETIRKLTAACEKVSEVMAEACDWPDTTGELNELHAAVSEMRFALPETPGGDKTEGGAA